MEKLLRIINTVRVNKAQPALPSISESARLREDIGFDSIDMAELTVRIEAEFGVDVFADGIVWTVGEILEKTQKQ